MQEALREPRNGDRTKFRDFVEEIAGPGGSVGPASDTTTGSVVQKIEYSPYGRVLSKKSARMQPFGFAGGLWDRDTGLLRFGARDYDPETGRWTARDPIRFASGDPNLFGYVLRDPVNRVDPSAFRAV